MWPNGVRVGSGVGSGVGPRVVITLSICFVFVPLVKSKVYARELSKRTIYTRYGKFRGLLVEFDDRSLKPVEAYLGLTYASILGGTLRFMPPTSPMHKWNGIRNTIQFKEVCPQRAIDERQLERTMPEARVRRLKSIAPFIRKQTEDCLNLNLYVPIPDMNDTSSEAMPVMVFIHGESYETGTGNAYDGSVLASFGKVIVVTLNYRMGVLGFMSTGEGDTSGNYAILDQMAAMHWLRENIQSFGGDPNRVTLFGHGYGAALVNILLVSPVTKDGPLFQRAILQSGSALSSWAVAMDPVECTQRLAAKVNCSQFVDDPIALLGCLRNKSYVDLVNAAPLAPKYYSCFAPSISPQSSVLPHSVEDLHKNPVSIFKTAQLMFGGTKHEAYGYLKQSEIENGISEERKKQILRTYVHNTFRYHRQKIYEILDHHYTDWDRHVDDHARRDGILELLGDGQFVAPMMKVGNYHAKVSDTYLYNFGYSPQSSTLPRWAGGVYGDELPYVFGAPLVNGVSPFPPDYSKTERMLSEVIMRYWTNFAKTGNPNLPNAQRTEHAGRVKNRFIDLNWPTYDAVKQEYLAVGKRPKVGHHYRGRQLALWLDLIPKLHQPDGQEPEHHLLDQPENMSTFDDPTRLLTKFKEIFPPPPPTAPPSPPSKGEVSGVYPELSSQSWLNPTDEDGLTLQPEHLTPYPLEGSSSNARQNNTAPAGVTMSSSSVPLSITIAVGCSLLFLNILIFAGIYYQRERIKKIRKAREDPEDVRLTRKIEREVAKNVGPESVSLLPATTAPAPSLNKPMDERTNIPRQPMPVRAPQPPAGAFSYTSSSNSSSMQRQSPGRGMKAQNGSSTPQIVQKDTLDRHKPHEIHATFRDGAPPAYNSTTAV